MNKPLSSNLRITAEPEYIPQESDPDQNRFVFAYTIHIHNSGTAPVRLLQRHWIITDSDGDVREVSGIGVVGQQPLIDGKSTYSYTSGAVFNTELGYMEGDYTMRTEDGEKFSVSIPRFRLVLPFRLH